jgi:hypothetical protein
MFMRWLRWRLTGRNIDHYAWNLAYMNTDKSPTGKPMTRAQRLWFSYLFGTTYQSSMAWVFYWHYPDPMQVDMTELDAWNRATMSQQRFATDTRYNKGHAVRMWNSFRDWVNRQGSGDIEQAFDSVVTDNPADNYRRMIGHVRNMHKFGRMTGWLFMQCLRECADLPIEPDTMHTDDPSNVSVWNGMCYYQSNERHTVGSPPKYAGYKPKQTDRHRARQFERTLLEEAEQAAGPDQMLSYFTLETHLCQFKKLNTGGDYPGQNVGDAVTRYHELKHLWPRVDFGAFEDAVNSDSMYRNIRWQKESKALFGLFKATGQPINMNNLFDDMPDMHAELAIDPSKVGTAAYEPTIRQRIDLYSKAQAGGWASQSQLLRLYEQPENQVPATLENKHE